MQIRRLPGTERAPEQPPRCPHRGATEGSKTLKAGLLRPVQAARARRRVLTPRVSLVPFDRDTRLRQAGASLARTHLTCSGLPLRLVAANSSSCSSLIDSYISRDA